MDWLSVFDVTHPQPGATDAEIAEFVAAVSRPMSRAEIREVQQRQRNPFPKGDRFHDTWRPIDPTTWVVPNRPMPESYLSFLKWSNGGEFGNGDRWFQFFPTRCERQGVRAMLLAYELPEYMPGAMPIAFDGQGTFFLFDMRQPAVGGEYPIVRAHAGYLGWEAEASGVIADSFLAMCRGRTEIR